MKHLQDAKIYVRRAEGNRDVEVMQAHAQIAIAHAAIAQAEFTHTLATLVEQLLKRLPPPAEPWSEVMERLQNEARAQEKALEETRDRVARGRVRGGTGAAIHIDTNKVQGADVSGARIIGGDDEL